ncbi:2,3-dihydro-2,3-dihydroxybenzoate dehydrogenase [Tumebacillus algifaecis]|uniref:2,3-dihydro-2,3-dihydroxybenzoate dehydrogenase n=1 Tax=Tumebacillus algifaecis TaxID=1214604 RepID=A0A223D383_9BACL|nr:2,3-dihydro-2,3-dihydroxybenzoate dehydrogenase [Tumebacillus algifaecis]ASS75857.1 2,3-dihydro-2,3-dihydroxybenzoate dehydrogenase [Tumebacillus algifaecis]
MKNRDHKGRVVLVTGAAQGIGAAVARAFVEAGEFVVAVDKNSAGLDQIMAELNLEGKRAAAFPLDVSDKVAVEAVVEQIERDLGPIEILVNVAGLLRMGPIDMLRDEDWEETFAVNVSGVFYVSRSVIRRMVPRQSGSIVTVGSNAASVPRMHMAAYASSKAAVTMFTKCLGLENAQHHIRCNVVSPGSTDTEMQRSMWTDANGADAVIVGSLASYKLGIPLQKLASPSDIADAVLFLASDRASHITMHDLRVDGGATLGN